MRRFGLYDVPGESGDYIRPPAGPRSIFRQQSQTTTLEERPSDCPADCLASLSFSFPDHRRVALRTAHLSSSQVRYSCRANTGECMAILAVAMGNRTTLPFTTELTKVGW